MNSTYLAASSLSKADFNERKTKLAESEDATLTSAEDVERIENLLDLSRDILKGQKFWVSKSQCPQCDRSFSFYDFVFTALVEQWHTPSFLAHTLVGAKYFLNEPRAFRCSSCGSSQQVAAARQVAPFPYPFGPIQTDYETPHYGCCRA